MIDLNLLNQFIKEAEQNRIINVVETAEVFNVIVVKLKYEPFHVAFREFLAKYSKNNIVKIEKISARTNFYLFIEQLERKKVEIQQELF